ncbi:ATP-binding cassette domain-containing protein [Pseudooceanicola nanhaiensis]|uniref:thiamine ABC transporter ATP-binding protein n=1 Tax=Pseudooceanicola nanhaiensis TaxID=375761 RepID=UPI001CD3DA82|nr:ATP-binding cassette domain-containing protein [Pseudooceanicola nanhaiensis]MCA0920423.1 ATP-binding cassette domain-containing protein [Pseudooceanicola nanhaiensis]
MLTLDHLILQQGDFSLTADLTLPRGSRCALIGPSGAGKSTLLNAIAGFLPPRTGRILWEDRDLTALAPAARPVAMLFQDGNLFPHLDIARNVALGLSPNLRLTANDHARVREALARVGLDGMGDRRPGALSGGQQSRAALARVLVQNRPLLLLDEPFAALGPALRAEMLALVRAVVEETGATLLMVTHAPEDARRIADRLILVSDNRAEPPAPIALLDDPTPALRAYLGEG